MPVEPVDTFRPVPQRMDKPLFANTIAIAGPAPERPASPMAARDGTGRAAILLIANNFPPVRGGSSAVYASLARCAASGIIVLAPSTSYTDGRPLAGWGDHDRKAGFRVCRLPLLRTRLGTPSGVVRKMAHLAEDLRIRGRVGWSVLRLLVRERPRAVCIGELMASGWMLHWLRFVPRLRTLVYVHGEEITTADPYDAGRRRCRRALRAADRIVVVSRFTEAAVRSMLGPQTAAEIHLISNGVDTARFAVAPRRPELVARFGLTGCFVFVSVCRLLEKKGIDQALRAFAAVGDDDCRFLVVGSGPYEAALRALATELGVAGRVVFVGGVAEDELADCYRLGDVFVMPNRALPNGDTEGFGLVFLEANGCGLPVIAGRDGGSTDAVHDGVNGLVVDGRSVPAIAGAMRLLRGDGVLRERLRQGGLDLVARSGWEQKAHAFLAIAAAAE